MPWIQDLGVVLSLPLAIFIIGGLAIFPGYLNAFLLASLLLDRPRILEPQTTSEGAFEWPALTLLIAAFNEDHRIGETLDYAVASEYPGPLRILVADDGSSDRTLAQVEAAAVRRARVSHEIEWIECRHRGKAGALNEALVHCDTNLVATIDADTLLMPDSLMRAVARLLTSPPEIAAVAGAVLVRNSRSNWLTRLQEWDYQLGIAAIKRSQGIWQSTLVAQGAFSVFRTEPVREVGGWPDMIGEDIVMTWALLSAGYETTFEASAIAFTGVPEHFGRLARQRSRWARGMIEGLAAYGRRLIGQHKKATHGVLIDALFPWMDLCYTFAFLPGVVLALTGNFALVGPMTLAVLPINLLLASLMFRMEKRSFGEVGLSIRKNFWGFLSYLFLYQPMMSPLALVGYGQQLFKRPHKW